MGFSWLHRQLDLRFHHFASTIAQSSLLISPDTSSIHIADAFRVPVIGLYPQVQWNAVSWRPYRTECEIVMPEAGFIAEISVEEVWHAFLRLRRRVRSLA
jgi:ADP-heptose:LPS heptosyltransferase